MSSGQEVPGAPPRRARGWRAVLRDLGPGLILAATGIGVGDMVAATIAGAEYGLTLVWALAAGVLVKFTITEGVARWQLATGTTLVAGWRTHLPRALHIAFFAYFIVWSYIVSSALVAASAIVPAAVMPSVPLPVWGFLHAVAAFVLVLVGRYERFLDIMKWFIGMKVGAVLLTNLLILRTGADWSRLGSHAPLSLPYVLSMIGGVGGTVTLLSYGYWMREQGWERPERMSTARNDLTVSFSLVFVFSLAMMFLSSQIEWDGRIVDQGPRLCLLLADRIGRETGEIGRVVFLAGFWGAAFSSVLGVWHGVPFLFDDWIHLWKRQPPTGQRGGAYRGWASYQTAAAVSALIIQRPVWLVFVYTVVGSLFFPFVIWTLLWLNNSTHVPAGLRNRAIVNGVLIASLLLYAYLGASSIL